MDSCILTKIIKNQKPQGNETLDVGVLDEGGSFSVTFTFFLTTVIL